MHYMRRPSDSRGAVSTQPTPLTSGSLQRATNPRGKGVYCRARALYKQQSRRRQCKNHFGFMMILCQIKGKVVPVLN
jgi:hypothetical protein